MSYCPKCKKTGGCTHTDRQFPYSLPAEMARLERALNVEREAHARTLAALKLRGCDFHEFKADGWTACAAEMPLDQKGWCRTCAAIAAAKVTP